MGQTFLKIIAILVILLAVSELTARAFGYRPWRVLPTMSKTFYVPDRELGWLRAGYGPGLKPLSARTPLAEIVLIGGSFTEGAGLHPEETLAEKLGALRPNETVLNLGTGAYGTYQSLLLLRRYTKLVGVPKLVVYGFVDFHEYRNVADGKWMKGLAWANSSGTIHLPYCMIDAERGYRCHPPVAYPNWPLRDWFALIPVFEEAHLLALGRAKREVMDLVTLRIIEEMKEEVESAGGRFVLLYLASSNRPKEYYLTRFSQVKLPAVDCVHPSAHLPEYVLESNGHPNEKLNAFWADCLSRAIESSAIYGAGSS